jgi:ribonuclease BN (tRNA processing enzyme)
MGVYLESDINGRLSWRGNHLKVEILHSRAGLAQHIWIENENRALLVDCGDGCLRDLLAHRLDIRKLEAVMFTHGHFDHVGGLHSLLGFNRMIGRRDDLNVIMPHGCIEVGQILKSFVKSHGDSLPFRISAQEISEKSYLEIGKFMIRPYELTHHGSMSSGEILEQIPALGYKIIYESEIIAVTGDTGNDPKLEALIKDADLAIIEATFPDSREVDREILAKVHLTEDIAHSLGRLAKNYVLVHKSGL